MNDMRGGGRSWALLGAAVLNGAAIAVGSLFGATADAATLVGRSADPAGHLDGLDVRAPYVPTVPTDVQLPVRDRAPSDPYAATPEVVLGRIQIPRIGLDANLGEGVTLTAIDRGPGHWPGTALPGEVGNVVVAGHRTTHSRPFWALDELDPGDELIFRTEDGEFRYSLVETTVVRPSEMHIVEQRYAYEATLFACHPRGSARYRIVARFELTSAPSPIRLT